MSARRKVCILLFDDVELLDFAGPMEVFTAADELSRGERFEVFTVSPTGQTVRTANGLRVLPDHPMEASPPFDLLVVPGGFGTRALLKDETVLSWIARSAAGAEIVMSVCTGSLLLGKLGLLDGLRVTTHHEVVALLERLAPRATVVRDQRFADHGRICTAAGVSAGIDLALHLVARLHGAEAAQRTASYIEYEQR